MSSILDTTFVAQTHVTTNLWPKCRRCTDKIGKPYPVEAYGIVGVERPTELGAKMRLVIEAECHGLTQRARLSVPRWWGSTMVQDAIGDLFFFQLGGDGVYTAPEHKQLTRIK